MSKTLVFRADASPEMGTGHAMRCLTLASAWRRWGNPSVFVVSAAPQWLQDRIEEEGHQLATVAEDTDAADTLAVARGHDAAAVVVDGYQFTETYQQAVREAGLPLVFFDDYVHCRHYYADFVVNQNLHARNLFYPRENYTRLLLGPHYAMLREEFDGWNAWRRRIPRQAAHLLVTLGGSDAENRSEMVLDAVALLERPDLATRVIIGPSNPNRARLEQAAASCPGPTELLEPTREMAEMMAWADAAVAAGGTTSWELAYMGLPSILLVLAENQRLVAGSLHDAGACFNLGDAANVSAREIASALGDVLGNRTFRKQLCKNGRKLVDGRGKWRVASIIEDTL